MRTNRCRPIASRLAAAALVGFLLACPAASFGQDAASALLRLVPADSPLVLTVENLREHCPAFVSSTLAKGLIGLPAVREWMATGRYRKLTSARDKIEAFLGTPIATIRDAIFGDAVVVALQVPTNVAAPVPAPERVEAVLLLRARNPELLRRLARLIDDAQVAAGRLARCVERRQGETVYTVREYPAEAKRTAEYHVDYPDGTFALSNSESLILEVIDRRERIESGTAAIKELAGLPGFQAVARRLPEPGKAVCRLFVDSRLIEYLASRIPRPADPADARALALIARYALALNHVGAALTWRDDVLTIQTAEAIDPAKLDPALIRWAKDPRPLDPALAKVPATAFAMASAGIDLEAVYALFGQLLPDEQRPRLANLESALSGLLLGQDLHRRIFPALGPSWIAYSDAPEESDPTPRVVSAIPLVVAVSLNDSEPSRGPATSVPPGAAAEPPAVTIAAAIDNALRTVLAVTAINHKRNRGLNRIISREVAGAKVITFDTPIPFAYALDRARRRLVIGNSARAIGRYLEASDDPEAGSRFHKIRAVADPNAAAARLFLGIDFRAIHSLAGGRRDQLAGILAERRHRPEAEPARDLDQVLALIALFDSAFVTSRIEPDASSCVRRIGLIARPDLPLQSP
jgi:hypothetical protein